MDTSDLTCRSCRIGIACRKVVIGCRCATQWSGKSDRHAPPLQPRALNRSGPASKPQRALRKPVRRPRRRLIMPSRWPGNAGSPGNRPLRQAQFQRPARRRCWVGAQGAGQDLAKQHIHTDRIAAQRRQAKLVVKSRRVVPCRRSAQVPVTDVVLARSCDDHRLGLPSREPRRRSRSCRARRDIRHRRGWHGRAARLRMFLSPRQSWGRL